MMREQRAKRASLLAHLATAATPTQRSVGGYVGARELVRVERSASWDRVKIPFDLTITIIRKEALT